MYKQYCLLLSHVALFHKQQTLHLVQDVRKGPTTLQDRSSQSGSFYITLSGFQLLWNLFGPRGDNLHCYWHVVNALYLLSVVLKLWCALESPGGVVKTDC